MCGIAGFHGPGDHDAVLAMTRALAHRGPDGEGIYADETAGVYLGHRRLAILDIAGGHQPMWNETDDIGVVYNGEIYNHMELRHELKRCGHVFRSDHSDTEVLVHGYEEWGEDLPGRLNGMFAFAIYDQPRRRFFLARDRFGEKPLYYLLQHGLFAFASELSALNSHPDFACSLDSRSLQKLFAYGYLPAPNALYLDCHKLPGGTSMTYSLDSGDIAVRPYWQFRIDADDSLLQQPDEILAEELRGLLEQAVLRRLISDVPLGLFLSGGLDSSSVLALAARNRDPQTIKTFTMGFTERSFDESIYAREIADQIGSDHHEDILDISRVRDLMPDVLSRLDEPLGDPSILPMHVLSEFTRKYVTVALSGDGGDELFCGYDPFKALAPAHWYQRVVPRALHRSFRKLADLMPISTANMSLDFKIKRGLMGVTYGPELWNPVWMAPLDPGLMQECFETPVRIEDVYAEALTLWERSPNNNIVDKTLEFYTNLYMQDDILMKTDRAAMLSSLEGRAVFLDNDLVDFCQRLPSHFKLRNGERKYLLKKAMAPLLPNHLLNRRKKGFGIPIASWLRDVPITPPLEPVAGINTDWVGKQWDEHRALKANHGLFLWNWLGVQYHLENMKAA